MPDMSKDELREVLANLTMQDRDDIDELIVCGAHKATIHRPGLLEQLGLIARLEWVFVYNAGPLTRYFELRNEVNFA